MCVPHPPFSFLFPVSSTPLNRASRKKTRAQRPSLAWSQFVSASLLLVLSSSSGLAGYPGLEKKYCFSSIHHFLDRTRQLGHLESSFVMYETSFGDRKAVSLPCSTSWHKPRKISFIFGRGDGAAYHHKVCQTSYLFHIFKSNWEKGEKECSEGDIKKENSLGTHNHISDPDKRM